jgi:hypothetical protein
VGRETGGGLICALDNASCVVLEWEEKEDLFFFGLDKAGFVLVKW